MPHTSPSLGTSTTDRTITPESGATSKKLVRRNSEKIMPTLTSGSFPPLLFDSLLLLKSGELDRRKPGSP